MFRHGNSSGNSILKDVARSGKPKSTNSTDCLKCELAVSYDIDDDWHVTEKTPAKKALGFRSLLSSDTTAAPVYEIMPQSDYYEEIGDEVIGTDQ